MSIEVKKFSVQVQGIEGVLLVVGVADTEDEFKKTTVKDFKRMVHAKRPEITTESMRILFAGKQLEEQKEGGGALLTLEEYKVKKNSLLHLVIRMPGGSEIRMREDLVRPGTPPEAQEKQHDYSDFSLRFTDKPDCIDPFPDPKVPKRVEMSCGHATGPNTLTAYCRSVIDSGDFEMRCPAIVNRKNEKCNKVWEYTEVRQVALLTDKECEWFESKIAERAALQYCDMKECPGCRSFVERVDLVNLRVHCIICKKKGKSSDFCWQCLHSWTGPTTSSDKCGREDCVHPDVPSIRDAPMMTLNGKQVPNRRACPTCGKVVEHNKAGCKMMMCSRCKKEFCFLCLELSSDCLKSASGQWYGGCKNPVAPKQTTIPVWHR